jgi:hypothetical protein
VNPRTATEVPVPVLIYGCLVLKPNQSGKPPYTNLSIFKSFLLSQILQWRRNCRFRERVGHYLIRQGHRHIDERRQRCIPWTRMTAVPIASNQFRSENCTRDFSSPYNLSRHQTTNACRPNAHKITPRMIVDVLTGQLRYRTPDEQRELARVRKVERYWDTM